MFHRFQKMDDFMRIAAWHRTLCGWRATIRPSRSYRTASISAPCQVWGPGRSLRGRVAPSNAGKVLKRPEPHISSTPKSRLQGPGTKVAGLVFQS